jgi:hypothetical protein
MWLTKRVITGSKNEKPLLRRLSCFAEICKIFISTDGAVGILKSSGVKGLVEQVDPSLKPILRYIYFLSPSLFKYPPAKRMEEISAIAKLGVFRVEEWKDIPSRIFRWKDHEHSLKYSPTL